jgi:hypothetical protein
VSQIRSIEARGLLGAIARGAKSAGADLLVALQAAYDSVATPGFRTGRVFISTSGSGQSASFLIPSELTADYSPTRVAAQYQEFIEIFNDLFSAGLITDGFDIDSCLAKMLEDARLQSVTRRRNDYSTARLAGGFSQ